MGKNSWLCLYWPSSLAILFHAMLAGSLSLKGGKQSALETADQKHRLHIKVGKDRRKEM